MRGFGNKSRAFFYLYNTGIIYSIYKEVVRVDYEKMYFELFNAVSEVIEKLQEVQRVTEEMYIEEKKD